MIIGLTGKRGAGKTLLMSALAKAFAEIMNVPIFSNYGLKGSQDIKRLSDLWKFQNAIICFDEIGVSIDARKWKDNVQSTYFVNQSRKKSVLMFYTMQDPMLIDIRLRQGTDFMIFCEMRKDVIIATFVDWYSKVIGIKLQISDIKRFYDIYDTYRVIPLMTW